MQLEVGKVYKTRDGQRIRIVNEIVSDTILRYPFQGVMNGCMRLWTRNGEYSENKHDWDLISLGHKEEIPSYSNEPQPPERNPTMNYSTAVMLINSNIRAIKVTYEPDTPGSKKDRYIFKTLDKSIKVGDYVVVPTDTRHNLTVVKVEEVGVDVDFESTIQIKWIVSRVDTEIAATISSEETTWIEALKASEKRRKREEIKKNMLDMYSDAGTENLAIANMSDPTVTPVIPSLAK